MFSLLYSAQVRGVVLQCLLLPAAVAVAILLIVRYGGRFLPASTSTALAFSAALFIGAYEEVLSLQPGQFAWQWLPTATFGVLLIGWTTSTIPMLRLRWLLRMAAGGLASWCLVPIALREASWWAVPLLGFVIVAEWALLARLASTTRGGQVPVFMALPLLAAFGIILHAHCGRLAEESLIAAGALLGMALVAGWVRVDCGGAAPGVAVLLPGLILAGHTETYSDVPITAFVVGGVAPLILSVTLLPGLNRWPGARLGLLRLILLLTPLIYAVFQAVRAEAIDLE